MLLGEERLSGQKASGIPMGPWLLTGDTYDTGWKEASYCKGVEHGGTFQDAKATAACL